MDLSRRFYAVIIAIFILATSFAIFLSKEFLMTIVISIYLAYIIYPLYAYFFHITGKRSVSSLLSLVIVVLGLASLIIVMVWAFFSETSTLLDSGETMVAQLDTMSGSFSSYAYKYFPSRVADNLGHVPARTLDWVVLIISVWAAAFAANLPMIFTHIVLTAFFTYYSLVEGRRLVNSIMRSLPEKLIIRRFLLELDDIYNSLFHVFMITAGVTGSIAAFGFYLLGLPYPLLLGILVALLELIPLLGSSSVVLPMAVYYILIHDYAMAGALVVLGTVFLSVIPENVIRPRLAQRGARIHPVITILAFTTPLFVLGPAGVILGPAVYGLALAGYRTLVYIRNQ